LLIAILFALVLVLGYYYRIRRFKHHEMLLRQKVAQKTYELMQMNSVLIKQAEELNETNSLLEERQKQIEGQSDELSAQKEELIKVNEELLEKAQTASDLEKQVIVHCYFNSPIGDSLIRIWRSTYLRDKESSHKSHILTAHNISFYPTWTAVSGGREAKFTLVFSALPKSCAAFDLFEDIPQGGGFFTGLISRNKSDVYSVEIYS